MSHGLNAKSDLLDEKSSVMHERSAVLDKETRALDACSYRFIACSWLLRLRYGLRPRTALRRLRLALGQSFLVS